MIDDRPQADRILLAKLHGDVLRCARWEAPAKASDGRYWTHPGQIRPTCFGGGDCDEPWLIWRAWPRASRKVPARGESSRTPATRPAVTPPGTGSRSAASVDVHRLAEHTIDRRIFGLVRNSTVTCCGSSAALIRDGGSPGHFRQRTNRRAHRLQGGLSVRPQGLRQAPGAKAQFRMRMTHEATRPTGPSFHFRRCNSGVSSSRTRAVSSTVPGVTKPRRNRRTSGRPSAACLRAFGTIVAHLGTSVVSASLTREPRLHAAFEGRTHCSVGKSASTQRPRSWLPAPSRPRSKPVRRGRAPAARRSPPQRAGGPVRPQSQGGLHQLDAGLSSGATAGATAGSVSLSCQINQVTDVGAGHTSC